jgi:molybdenum cofactor cytidylyltransferase
MRLWPRVGCVVLAAGEGKRFSADSPKLLLAYGASSLLQRSIDTAVRSQASSCTLVVGAAAERLLASVDTRRCAVAVNTRWKLGLSGSIRAGLAQHADDDACIFMIADQPYVTVEDLNGLIRRFAQRRTSIVALRAGDVWGSPMLFPRSDFRALARLHGDAGAKGYAARHRQRLEFVEAARLDALTDVDTAEDYKRIAKS